MKRACEICRCIHLPKGKTTKPGVWNKTMKGFSHGWCPSCCSAIKKYGYSNWLDKTAHFREDKVAA